MPNDWESHYVDNHTPWDKGSASPGLVDFLAEAPLTGKVLVPGCGMGHDVRAIAAASPAVEVVGFDIAPTAVQRARELPPAGSETYEEGDLFNLSASMVGEFDWIWEHTCYCAIDPEQREAYVASVRQALKPSGQLLGVFYLDPYDDEHQPGDGPPHGTSLEDLEAKLSAEFEIVSSWQPKSAYPGREGLEHMLLLRAK